MDYQQIRDKSLVLILKPFIPSLRENLIPFAKCDNQENNTIFTQQDVTVPTMESGSTSVGEGVLGQNPVRDVLDRDSLGEGVRTDADTRDPIVVLVSLGTLSVVEVPDRLLETIIFQVTAKYVVPIRRASAVLNRERSCSRSERTGEGSNTVAVQEMRRKHV